MGADQRLLLSVPEAAARLGKGRSTLYRWIADGKVPHRVMPDGYVKFTEDDVKAIIAAAHRPAAAPRQRAS